MHIAEVIGLLMAGYLAGIWSLIAAVLVWGGNNKSDA